MIFNVNCSYISEKRGIDLAFNNNINDIIKKVLFPSAFIFPFVLSMGACSGIGALWSCIITVILTVFVDKFDKKNLLFVLLNFTVISYLLNNFGYVSAVITLAVSGIVFCFGNKFSSVILKIKESSAYAGLMLATALTVTVLQTTNYFGIGATGNTPREMIESYVSLGFHGNWRGVLYGTIVLVIMITYPRKFKKFSKIIHASFFALIITVVLNYFLNPPDMITSINEISALEFNRRLSTNITVWGTIISIICGIIIAFSNEFILLNDIPERKDFLKVGITNIILAPALCFVPQKINKSAVKNIPIAALMVLFLFLIKDVIIRIPVHSCAVVLIVGVWQAVDWKSFKKAFKNPASVFIFLLPVALFLLY